MDQSFGSWMLTGGIRGEIEAEARHLEHVRTIRDLQADRRAAARARRSAAVAKAFGELRARFSVRGTQVEPDCCPA